MVSRAAKESAMDKMSDEDYRFLEERLLQLAL